ncbi:MAG: Rossmann-like and DUF2520 domain-containing protein [Bacteroidales bacterium]
MEIVFLGAGNLATNLALNLKEAGYNIKQVYSRTIQSARDLADITNAAYTNNLSQVADEADLFIVAVKDDAIEEVLKDIKIKKGLLVHTAGSVPLDVLSKYHGDFGVFYPLQTFSKQKRVEFNNIPICLEANSGKNMALLDTIAGKLTNRVYHLSSEERLYIHIAAVFACNFTNFMFVSAERLLKEKNIPFSIIHQLIRETTEKAYQGSPASLQTGPAIRNDRKTIDKHLKLLADDELFQNLYRFVSNTIIQYYNKETEE